jgi:hypothetical protein
VFCNPFHLQNKTEQTSLKHGYSDQCSNYFFLSDSDHGRVFSHRPKQRNGHVRNDSKGFSSTSFFVFHSAPPERDHEHLSSTSRLLEKQREVTETEALLNNQKEV